MARWKKIASGDLEKKLGQKIDIIVAGLGEEAKNPDVKAGLLSGKAGIAICLYYYAKWKKSDVYAQAAFDMLSNIIDMINEGYDLHTFCNGLAGVFWTLEHLAQKGFLDADTDELVGKLNHELGHIMIEEMKTGHYDYLHGAMGLAIYFLTKSSKKEYQEYLSQFIQELDKHGIRDKKGAIKWESIVNHEKESRGFNLSLSHGIASIIGYLFRAWALGIEPVKSEELLNGAIQYLQQQRIEDPLSPSLFPSWVSTEEESKGGRLAWCYGDLGVGISLFQASQVLKKPEWQALAMEALGRTLKRKDPEKEHVLDAGFCHGSTGIAHIYNRMFQYTGNADFKSASIYWLEEVLKMAKFPDSLGGYKTWRSEEYGGWVSDPCVLEGTAGIALSMMAAVTSITPSWDYCLLLSSK